MKKAISLFSIIVVLSLAACSSSDNSDNSLRQLNKVPNGDAYYGGMFSWNEEEFFRTLYPPAMGDAIGHRIANQIYEGLVRPGQYRPTGKYIPLPCVKTYISKTMLVSQTTKDAPYLPTMLSIAWIKFVLFRQIIKGLTFLETELWEPPTTTNKPKPQNLLPKA